MSKINFAEKYAWAPDAMTPPCLLTTMGRHTCSWAKSNINSATTEKGYFTSIFLLHNQYKLSYRLLCVRTP